MCASYSAASIVAAYVAPTVRGRTFLVRESFAELMRPTTDDAPRVKIVRLQWYRLLIAFMAGLCVPTVCVLVALWLLQ